VKITRIVAAATAGISLAIAGAIIGSAPAGATTRYTVPGNLLGVSADAPNDAWAVGYAGQAGSSGVLLAHWTGQSWTRVQPVATGQLLGVAAVSPTSAWAVGGSGTYPYHPWMLNWNGTNWHTVQLPGAAPGELTAVTATATDAWAVGVNGSGNPITFHWTKASPTWVFVSAPGAGNGLNAVASVSASSAWAAGEQRPNGVPQSTLAHWGTSWQGQAFPISGSYRYLDGLAADADGLAWGVGTGADDIYGSIGAVSMFYNGRGWGAVTVPGSGASSLYGVAAGPSHSAWAVGKSGNGTLALRWTGNAWAQAATPNPLDSSTLEAVAASSATDAWAVGFGYASVGSTAEETLILHWNGGGWS
jgi:hypothetical protein